MNSGIAIQPTASLTVVVKGLNKTSSQIFNERTVYNVAGQLNGQTVYGTNHIGNNSGWNDHFVLNYKDLEFDDLDFVVFQNDRELGRGKMNLYQVMLSLNRGGNEQVQLRNRGNVVGYLIVDTIRGDREQIVGGLRPPLVSLRQGPLVDDPLPPPPPPALGIERVHANKLNFFSCLDAKGYGWEFSPDNFQTKIQPRFGSGSRSNLPPPNMQQGFPSNSYIQSNRMF